MPSCTDRILRRLAPVALLWLALAGTAAGQAAPGPVPGPEQEPRQERGQGSAGQPAAAHDRAEALARIGRAATPAEVAAWDIDVRADFVGLPPGKGDVATGEAIWEEKCASCHGIFGESNEVFTPLVGGTTTEDVAAGRVRNLKADAGFAQRTTLMKAPKVATLWDYINRAMPWDAPKSLQPDEVYAVLAYMLNLGDIIPSDFVLSNDTMAAVQARMPNRDGMVPFPDLWDTGGRGDVANTDCMTDCPIEGKPRLLPVEARDTHGNIAEQVRPFGPARGTDTSRPPRVALVGQPDRAGEAAAAPALAAAAPAQPPAAAAAATPAAATLAQAKGCLACHGIANKLIGPAFRDVAKKHAQRADLVEYLAGRIVKGGQGVWGPIPMPAQTQLQDADATVIARWIAEGAR